MLFSSQTAHDVDAIRCITKHRTVQILFVFSVYVFVDVSNMFNVWSSVCITTASPHPMVVASPQTEGESDPEYCEEALV